LDWPKIRQKADSDPELQKSKSQILSGILIELRTEANLNTTERPPRSCNIEITAEAEENKNPAGIAE